jgi:flagellin
MSLRINTNISSLAAQNSLRKTDFSFSTSLERLSTGLRINKSADDASGMSIANTMKAQALGIGQAVRNANDGISIIQIADGALDESVNIINTIKTKAVQAAQDGQTLESRNAIQADIDKLLAELDDIAQTTSFNGMKLLSGNFMNKEFQVGATSGQTVSLNIGAAESGKIGHIQTADLQLTNSSGGKVELSVYSNLQNRNIDIASVDLQFNNSASNGMGALADALNRVSDSTGITAQAIVTSESVNAVAAGSTGSDFAINGVTIGALTVQANDADEALTKAINAKTAQHGVIASITGDGKLSLTSSDGRAIEVTGSTGDVLAGSNMSTMGHIKLFQTSGNEIQITDKAGGAAIAATANVTLSQATTTTIDSTLKAGSVIASTSTLKAGTTIGFTLTSAITSGDITTTQDSLLKAGSSLASDSIIEQGSVVGGTAGLTGAASTTTNSTLKAGSVLRSGTVLEKGTLVTTDISTAAGTIAAGTVLNEDATLNADVTLQADMIALGGSTLAAGTQVTAGSSVGADITLSSAMTLTQDMVLKANSTIEGDGGTLNILAGSTIGGDIHITSASGAITTTADTTLKAGSTLISSSELASGSTIGGDVHTNGTITLNADMTLAAGSTLASNTTMAAGTVLTNDITTSSGVLAAGTVLERAYVTSGSNYLENAMTLKYDASNNSVIAATSVLATNDGGVSGTEMQNVQRYTLADIDVTSQEGAQVAITIADAALKSVNAVKAELGSIQNQLTSTVANLSVTQVNVTASESQIRDVDFAAESSNFSRMQVLMQSGTFALAQANSSSQNVLQLLQ